MMIRHIQVETKTAVLPSAGYNGRKATRHVYVYSEAVVLHPDSSHPIHGIGHFFKCTETGEIRRWGFDRGATDARTN